MLQERDCSVPSATHAEVMKSGNLTQESPSSVGADRAAPALGQSNRAKPHSSLAEHVLE